MKLKQLLRDVPVVAMRGSAEIEVSAVTADSRQVTPGSLFVAVSGLNVDGAKFIANATQKGATVVVSETNPEPGTRNPEPVVHVQVNDARAALALIASNFHGRPSERLALIGVTGTSGKTTTTKMIEAVLEATGAPVGLIGTIDYRAGSIREVADRTTPDAVVLQEWFAKMVQEDVRYAVMEVSSHALALRRTHGIPFAAAVFTNLSRDHFDFHKDEEDYFKAKRMLFDQIDRTRRTAVVNIDDAFGRRIDHELAGSTITYGRKDADIYPAHDFNVSVEGLHGFINTPSGSVAVRSPLLGWPNLYNWMAAIGAAIAVGINTDTIAAGIRKLQSVRGRFERVGSPDGATVLVDYAHKPDALEKLLRAVRELAPEKKIVLVFGCGGDRDAGKRPLMGAIAGELADYSIITSDNPRTEDPAKIIIEIENGIRSVTSPRYETIGDRREAINRAIGMSTRDHVVVIAGKGHENYQVVGDRIIHFDDREEVEAALNSRAKIAH